MQNWFNLVIDEPKFRVFFSFGLIISALLLALAVVLWRFLRVWGLAQESGPGRLTKARFRFKIEKRSEKLFENFLIQQLLKRDRGFSMGQMSYAVFVDLENAGAKQSTLQNIIEKVKIRGDILLGKVYGYTDRYTELKEVLLSNTFNVVPSLRYGKNQKNNLDIQLVIDAMEVAYANPLIKVTIVPRGRALGAAWYLPEERQITTKEQMLDEMCATLGGRAAEELFTGHISSGALNDLERVTKQAYGMIAYLGMSKELPNLCYYSNEEYNFSKPYSDRTAQLIDEEVKKMINEQYERAKALLTEHREGHAQLAKVLVEREVIYAEDVEKIFGKRPWTSRTEELLSLNEKENANKDSEELTENKAQEAALPAPDSNNEENGQTATEDGNKNDVNNNNADQ